MAASSGSASIVEPIHARMPVILQPEQEAAWIDPAVQDPAQVRELLKSDAAPLVTRAVLRLVNYVRNDRPELLAEELISPRSQGIGTCRVGHRSQPSPHALRPI
jgi:putative SOS response-associated peptidase YedK